MKQLGLSASPLLKKPFSQVAGRAWLPQEVMAHVNCMRALILLSVEPVVAFVRSQAGSSPPESTVCSGLVLNAPATDALTMREEVRGS